MFKLNENFDFVTSILKCDSIRCSPSEIKTLNNANSQVYINKPTEDSVIFFVK